MVSCTGSSRKGFEPERGLSPPAYDRAIILFHVKCPLMRNRWLVVLGTAAVAVLAIAAVYVIVGYPRSNPFGGPSTEMTTSVQPCFGTPISCTVQISFRLFNGGDGDGNSFVLYRWCSLLFGDANHNSTATLVSHNSTLLVATCSSSNGTAPQGAPVSGWIGQQLLNAVTELPFNGTAS